MDLEDEGQVLLHGHIGKEAVVLEDHADPAAVVGHLVAPEVLQVLAGEVHGPLGGHEPPQNQGEEGGLARPRVAHHVDELALLDLQVHVVKGLGLGAGVLQAHPAAGDHAPTIRTFLSGKGAIVGLR